MYNLIIRPLLFCIDPEKVHRMLLSWLKFYRYLFPVRACVRGYSRVSDPFSYGHLQFKNRIGLSAGFDKNAEAFDELADFGFGFLEVGTVTPDSQSGNPSPRIFRLVDDESLISRTGFNNCGVDAVRQHIRKYRKHSYVLGVNINKNPLSTGDQIVKDFESTFIHLYDCVDYFTLNWGSIDNDLFAMVLEKLTIFRQAANKSIPSEKMYHQIQKNISRKQIKRICFRVAAILIPVIFLVGLYLQINSRVDLFGTTEYEEIRVAKGERIQMMFQDGTRVYINSDSWLKYPKKFGLSKREVFLVGEAYFVVAKNKKRPFIVNLNGPSVHVLGTSFDVQAYPENKDIVICLDEGHVNLTLSSAKEYPLLPGEKLIYNKESDQCRIIKNDHSKQVSMWKDNVISFKDTPLTEVVKVLNRWYNVNFKIEDEQASKYVYTLTSDNTILEKVLQDLEKIAPVKFEYDEVRKEVTVRMKQDGKK